MMELYKKHRPKLFKEVVGQERAVKTLQALLKKNNLPHCLILSGPSGCGKTTVARILKGKLECSDNDFEEINAADDRGIDMARLIRSRATLAPLGGGVRIWLIDEAHQLTSQCQNALLKLLEDTPKHVYFMLATTDPDKLLKTVQTRSTEVRFGAIESEDLATLLTDVAQKEMKELDEDVRDKIVEMADGSARKALVLYQQVIEIDEPKEQLATVVASSQMPQVIQICRVLVNPRAKWAEMSKVLQSVKLDDPESLRWMVLGYAKAILLKGGPLATRAASIIECFRDHLYDSKAAGFIANCWHCINER